MPPAQPLSSTVPADPDPALTQDTNNGLHSTPDTINNMTAIRKAFANGGDPSSLNLTDPSILTAPTSIIRTSTTNNQLDAIYGT